MALALRWVFCTDIRTDSDFCFIWHLLNGFCNRGFGGLVVSMLASGTQDRGFDPGRSLPWGGSKAVSHVADLRGMSKNPGFTWKSKSQAKLTGHFSPVIPSFADRGLSCRLHVEAKVGTSKGWGKQWQPTPKKQPRMQCARAIPVAWLGSGSCHNRPSGWILMNEPQRFCIKF